MSTAKINIKNIDYFKYRRLVIDGNRDDYAACSREVKSLCDAVQTLTFRDDEFDDLSDKGRFDDVCTCYRQILASKRIDPLDMRLKSGWWGEPGRTGSGYSAGKIKSTLLLEVLSAKTRDWTARHHDMSPCSDDKLDGRGLFVFKHRERQCFQLVARADNVFVRCAELLKAAFDGSSSDPLSALLVISLASDWDFYFLPVQPSDGERLGRILENDLILKHDTIWPHGLNFSLHMDSLIEVTEFRRSCLRHRWPPEYDTATAAQPELDLDLVRRQLVAASTENLKSARDSNATNDGSTSNKKNAVVNSSATRDQLPSQRQKMSTSTASAVDKSTAQSPHLVTKTTTPRDVNSDDTRSSSEMDKTTLMSKSPSKLKHPKQKTTSTASNTPTATTTTVSCTMNSSTSTVTAASVDTRSSSTSAGMPSSTAESQESTTTTQLTTCPSTDVSCDDTPAPGALKRSSTFTSLATDDQQAPTTLPQVS